MKYKESEVAISWLNSLGLRLRKISTVNEHFLVNDRFGSQGHLDEIERIVSKLLTHSFFNPINRTNSLGALVTSIFPDEVDKQYLKNFTSTSLINPSILSPVFDKEHFSLRVNPTESKTIEGILETSSRDFLLNTYHWSTLFSTQAIRRLKAQEQQYARQLIKVLCSKENPNEFEMDIGFFSVSNGLHHRSQWQWTNGKDIQDLFKTQDSSLIKLEQQYEYFSIKGDRAINALQRKNQVSLRPIDKKLFIIFIDSLDMDAIRQSPNNRYKYLKKLISESTVFNNFTASGDWTVPCLDSLHTGYSPENTLASFRSDPYLELLSNKYLIKTSRGEGVFSAFNYKYPSVAMLSNKKTRLSKNLLTNKLEKCGLKVVSVKGSDNHSWRYNLTPGITYSIENCSHNKTKENLSTLLSAVPGRKPDIYFIDIDLLHGCHGYRPDVSNEDIARPEYAGSLHWVGGYADSSENLMGKGSENERYKYNYLRKLDEVDKQVKGIMEHVSDQDEILLWSDHGSNYFEYIHSEDFVPIDCPAKLNKIWKPTLLIRSNLIKGIPFCNELVATVDLYQIILKLSNANSDINEDTDSNLPKILGGAKEREFARTFSPSERKTKQEDSKYFYLINRYKNQKGEVFKMDILPDENTRNLTDHNKLNYKQILNQ